MAITTLGNILVNEKLPDDLKDHSRILDKKNIVNVMTKIGENHQHIYTTVAKELKDLGDHYATALGSSFNLNDFKPVDMSHIYKKYDSNFADARKIKNEVHRETELKKINSAIEKEINDLVSHDIKNDKNNINKWVVSGAKGKPENIRQMRYAVGNQVSVTNQVFPHFAYGSLSEGLSPSSFFIGALGARKGVVGSFISVRDPGAFAKELFTLTNDMVTTEYDCGTHEGKTYDIKSPDILSRALLENTGTHTRNQIIDSHLQDDLIKQGIKTVKVRSPLYCHSKHGVCSMCVGLLETGKMSHLGDSVGVRSAQSLTEPLTQMALSSKHSGGVVGKKSAFETVKQLTHVPEHFSGGSVLSQKDGVVQSINKTPDGGTNIVVNNHDHYLLPNQAVLVKKGDQIKKGHALSDGLINPSEIVKLQGMEAGRNYLSEKLREVYADNGAIGHPKIFETVTRAAMNLGKVVDPGDHIEHSEGDIIRWNQSQHLTKPTPMLIPVNEIVGHRFQNDINIGNKTFKKGQMIDHNVAQHLKDHKLSEIEVYKNPMKIDPYMLGIERAALHKGDWLSNMGYRFVKNQLLDNLGTFKSTNLHSYDPIPSYVSGNFGYQDDGRF